MTWNGLAVFTGHHRAYPKLDGDAKGARHPDPGGVRCSLLFWVALPVSKAAPAVSLVIDFDWHRLELVSVELEFHLTATASVALVLGQPWPNF